MKKSITSMIAIILTVSMLLTLSVPVSAAKITPSESEIRVIDQDMATTIAMLFVASNLEMEDEWDMNLSISKVVPLYDANDEVNAYCIEMSNHNQCAGYVTVSTDINSSLIQEYAPGVEPLFENSNTSDTISTMSIVEEAGKVYYAGPLQYSENKQDVALMSESMENNSIKNDTNVYDSNLKLIKLISETGTLGDIIGNTASVNSDTVITNPLTYLKSLYPTATFTNIGWNNLGESAITRYYIYEYNACAMYAISAIIKYYINNGTAFSTIKNKVLQLYEDTYNNGNEVDNYYLEIGQYERFTDICLNYYGLSKSAHSTTFSWSSGTNEIDNGRPFMLNIWSANGGYYYDHTVTTYAYTVFASSLTTISQRFYKVRDGYTNAASSTDNGRYVDANSITASYITRVY